MTTSFFILRMYAKIKITRSIGWDDHLMTAAWVSNFSQQSFLRRAIDPVKVFLVVNQSLTYASMTYGVGRHVIYIPPLRLEYAAKLNYVAEIIEVIDLYLVKASLAILVLRMKPRPLFRWMMYGCLALLTAVNLAAVIIELAQCRPIQLNWNRLLGRGSCWSGRVLLVSAYLVSGRSQSSTSQCALGLRNSQSNFYSHRSLIYHHSNLPSLECPDPLEHQSRNLGPYQCRRYVS